MQIISVIIPAYNEGINVHAAYMAVKSVFEHQLRTHQYEIIFVDDGSADDTFVQIEMICKLDKHVKGIKFLNNAGAHTAIRAGLENCIGDLAVFMACDLQDPPDIFPQMVEALKEPYDIVLATRIKRDDTLKDKLFSRLFFRLMRKYVSSKLPEEGSSMYLLNKKVIRSLKLFKERNLTLESMFVLMHYKHTTVTYERRAREVGVSGWSFSKKIKILIDFFVAYSYSPIRYVTLIGILIFVMGIAWTLYVVLRTLFIGDMSPGWPALISVLSIGFGITNISLGIIAEYLWRVLDESRRRPNYMVDRRINFED